MEDLKDIKLLCGIDTLYYFVKTNENYDDIFLDIIEQLNNQEALFQRDEIDFSNKDIFITIKNSSFQYLNKAEGFYWLKDINEYFKIGFKDKEKNIRLHNIQVQLQGIGIYTIGLKPLLKYINDELLKDIRDDLLPVTRVDINCFINYDFSFIDKTMFVSRKKRYFTISDIGSSSKTQTLYVGKKPFMLRIYDKKLELEKSNKKEMMYEYFINNGLDIQKPIFNVEFQMHRTHLKSLGIDTLNDLLLNANSLYKKAMDDIRLIDINTVNEKELKNNNKNRAKTLPIWSYIKDNFSINQFLQFDYPLRRLKNKNYIYSYTHFIKDFTTLLNKAKKRNKNLKLSSEYIYLLAKYFLDEVIIEEKEFTAQKRDKTYTDVIYLDKNGNEVETKRLLDDGRLIKPVRIVSFKECSDEMLYKQIEELENSFFFEDSSNKIDISKKLIIAYEEKQRREAKNGS